MAIRRRFSVFVVAFFCFVSGLTASDGDSDPIYIACVEQCEKTGCVGNICLQHCNLTSDKKSVSDPWYLQEPLYIKWKKWDCLSGCRYQCMLVREEERVKAGDKPVKYHGKWPLQRAFGIEEPVAVALSALNLAVQFHGWVSFFILVNYKLPLKPNRQSYYEYIGLWHIYGTLSMNFLFWSAVYHSRDVEMTEKLDYSSGAAVLGFSLIAAIMRAFNVKSEASRVMVSAPLIAFVTTHILYLNCYQLDYGLNTKVCFTMAVAQLLIWGIWTGVSNHPSRWKIWLMVFGEALIIFFQIFDFPPFWGFLDADGLSHAIAIPVSYIWWSFIQDDSEHRTEVLSKKAT
uniref:post-GPI attachment to proteins factor 3-like n=1 Tax=Erigeron canadensis TaxID=72917 RepID=UPI001CB8A155|nr:post-GPI attachment to proteins factor 3-like [Erigeron canadensis]